MNTLDKYISAVTRRITRFYFTLLRVKKTYTNNNMLAGHRIQPAESVRAQLENTFCNHFHHEESFTNIAHRKTNR